MGLFKKKCCKLKHFKGFGEDVPNTMVKIMVFSEYKSDDLSYQGRKIMECSGCGKRGYLGGMHCMGKITSNIIDNFIHRKTGIEPMLEEFRMRGYRFIVHHNRINQYLLSRPERVS